MLRSGVPTRPLTLLGWVVMPVKGLASVGSFPLLAGLSAEADLVLSPWYSGLLAFKSLFSQPALGLGPLDPELVLL